MGDEDAAGEVVEHGGVGACAGGVFGADLERVGGVGFQR